MKLAGWETASVFRRYAIVNEAVLAEATGRLAASRGASVRAGAMRGNSAESGEQSGQAAEAVGDSQ